MVKSLFSILNHSSNSFEGQKDDEAVILLIRRHPFTIITRVGLIVLVSLVPIVIGKVFWVYLSKEGWQEIFLLLSSLWYLGFWLAIFHALAIYTLNTMTVTDQRVIDSDQHGLFNREISELHTHKIQDVTTHTNGLLETMLQFGDLTVQTAASEKQFVFCQIPHPEKVKDVIMRITSSRDSGVKTL